MEFSRTSWIEDRNVPGKFPPEDATLNGINKGSLPVGIPVADSVKYLQPHRLRIAYKGGGKLSRREASIGASYRKRLLLARQIVSLPDAVRQIKRCEWSVASQSGSGRYRVTSYSEVWDCECRDFIDRGQPCKHILAVLEGGCEETISSSPSPPRKRYSQVWGAYNLGQTNELPYACSLLRDLVNGVEEFPSPPGKPGRPPIPLRDQLFCSILKVYWGMSGRRANGAYEYALDRGLLQRTPNYMVASRLLNRPEATPILYRLLSLSALPLAALEEGGAVAPDSTGMQTTSFGAWREQKHGDARMRKWLKVHAMVGTRTHVVIRAVVSDADSGDAPQFGPLLRGSVDDGFAPSVVVADRGYLSRENYCLASNLGIEAYIPFKSNSLNRSGNRGSPSAWRKAFYLFQANREQFDLNYHRRSNIESVFSALKRKFGENIRSKTEVAQVNEVICKLICYNLSVVVHEMFEHGIKPNFSGRESDDPVNNPGFTPG